MIAHKQSPNREELAADIKRELRSGRAPRFLRAMPAFKVATDMPDYLRHLLDRLEECEAPIRKQRRP